MIIIIYGFAISSLWCLNGNGIGECAHPSRIHVAARPGPGFICSFGASLSSLLHLVMCADYNAYCAFRAPRQPSFSTERKRLKWLSSMTCGQRERELVSKERVLRLVLESYTFCATPYFPEGAGRPCAHLVCDPGRVGHGTGSSSHGAG